MISNNCNNFSVDGGIPRKKMDGTLHIMRYAPRVQDLQHPRLGKPRRGLQILDTRMGFPRPSLIVVLDSILLESQWNTKTTLQTWAAV